MAGVADKALKPFVKSNKNDFNDAAAIAVVPIERGFRVKELHGGVGDDVVFRTRLVTIGWVRSSFFLRARGAPGDLLPRRPPRNIRVRQ